MNPANTPAPSPRIELDCDHTIAFASQQNDVPIVRQLRISNVDMVDIRGARLRLTSEPELFLPWESLVDMIPSGGTYCVGPLDLRLSASLLMGLTERVGGSLRLSVSADGIGPMEHVEPIELLAFDEWSGLDVSLPELLAAFVLPNHSAVESILTEAANWLDEKTGSSALSGYQSRSPVRVGQIAQSIYSALRSRGIYYCMPPASFERRGQKIRLPDRILEARLATCLDLAVFAGACLEQAGLHPIIVMTEGHAFIGVWLIDECFADCATDDLLRLRKRVDLNEILVFETTLLTALPPNDFAAAVSAGRHQLAEGSQSGCVLDIQRCRKNRIRPLPVRRAAGEPASGTQADSSLPSDSIFDLSVQHAAVINEVATQQLTPATRLDRWKRKLLDLTLHNRLINFKPTKKTVPLLSPDLTALEDALADGLEFQILAQPADFGPDKPRSAELHRVRTGADAMNELLAGEFQARRLRANMSDQELQGRLTEIFRAAKAAMEEGGASTLYLALGFLAWYETDISEQRRLAPIILIPVELRRNSMREGFRIVQSDEEPQVNITLLELLTKDFDLRISGLEPIPQDEHGIDVRGILTLFRQAIKNIDRWDVVEEAHVGFFSFSKFLMWRDLEQRKDDLLKSKVVNHLVYHANQPYPGDGVFPNESQLDEKYQASETFCPLPSDSSQLAAVYASADEKSFVLFGPPGTGKSQTITNLIAHSLACGKSVLFVSEKMAALNVVHHRLSQCGLGPFCLELHSNKTNKRFVVDQLGKALDYRCAKSSDDWTREAERLSSARSELNSYVRALHERRKIGESVFQATSRLIGLRETPSIDLNLSAADTVTREQVDQWREAIDRIATAGDACGHPTGNAWSDCGIETWSPGIQQAVEADVDAIAKICDRLESLAQKLAAPLGLGTVRSLGQFDFLDKLGRFLMTSPRPPSALLLETDWDATEASVNRWIACGTSRDRLRTTLFQRYEERILQLDLDGLKDRLAQAKATWFLPRLLGIRAVRKALRGTARQTDKPDADAMTQDLTVACSLRDENKRLFEAGDRARTLLGQYWKDGEADWESIKAVRDWSARFRQIALSAAPGNLHQAAALRKKWARLVTEGHELLQPEGQLGRVISGFITANAELRKKMAGLASHLVGEEGALWGKEIKRLTLSDIRAKATAWKAATGGLRAWCNWRKIRREALTAGLEPLVMAYERQGLATNSLRSVFDRSFYGWWVDQVMQRESALSQFFSPQHERKIRQFREVDERYTQLTQVEIQSRLAARRPEASDRVSSESETGILRRQRGLRRGHMPVRQLFQKIPHLLPRLKPCVLMSPMSVAQYLDPAHPPFDLVVFDEASQIPVWDAVGAIARGKEAIIVGDPKQLPPTSFFTRADEQELNDDDVVEEMESILDECLSAQLPQMALRWHYRSRHESLIAFSNYYYYDNGLLTFPSPFVGKGVTYRHVPAGIYDKGKSRSNRAEAEAVVAEVIRRLRNPELSRLSIGIVTFSMAQQDLVEDLLDDARRKDPDIEAFFDGEAAEPVFVKNLENVQGDERDVILFSICYGPDATGRVSMNFGPLNRDGGERRLNVAITRARHEVLVFAALKAEHVDLSRTRARGVQDLKCFLDYAERGPVAISQAAILRGGDEFDSPFERAVCGKLRERGYDVHTQVGCSGYRIDLAIVDPEAPGRYLLGIECDGANYHSAKTARDRDRLREQILAGLGWRLHRVWSSDWWVNPDECLIKVDTAIEQAKLSRKQPTPPHVKSGTLVASVNSDPVEDDSADCEPEIATAAEALPVYRAYRSKRRPRSSDDFHLPTADEQIHRLIQEIVEHEGPLALDVLGRRVASHWGLKRLGSNMRERIERLARATQAKWVHHGETLFLWPRHHDPAQFNSFRIPGMAEDDQRDIDEIPPEEIAAAALHVLQRQISLPMEELIRETALVLGFQRAGQTIQRVAGSAVQTAVGQGKIHKDAEGRVRLP